jgi:hypothetical protein
LVVGSVGWKEKFAASPAGGAMLAATAGNAPVLIKVTKAVAALFTCTERLEGRTAATRGGTAGGSGPQPATKAKSKTLPVAPALLVPVCRQVPVWLIARAWFVSVVSPTFRGVQFAPPLMVLNTPELEVAA